MEIKPTSNSPFHKSDTLLESYKSSQQQYAIKSILKKVTSYQYLICPSLYILPQISFSFSVEQRSYISILLIQIHIYTSITKLIIVTSTANVRVEIDVLVPLLPILPPHPRQRCLQYNRHPLWRRPCTDNWKHTETDSTYRISTGGQPTSQNLTRAVNRCYLQLQPVQGHGDGILVHKGDVPFNIVILSTVSRVVCLQRLECSFFSVFSRVSCS